jgi:Protein of unknown function (DUF4230)
VRRYTAVIAAVGIVVVVALALLMAWRAAERSVANAPLTRHEETVDLATVVNQVRDLNRLETAAMHVVNVGTITQTYRMVPDALGGDEMTFLATGDVIAGIDLSRVGQRDAWREPDGAITLRLPPPQVLVTRLDNRESRVLSRKTGVLRRPDVDLESRMRQHAEIAIRQEAMKKGILPLASQNAETKLAGFLHALGFAKVRFVSTPPPGRPM